MFSQICIFLVQITFPMVPPLEHVTLKGIFFPQIQIFGHCSCFMLGSGVGTKNYYRKMGYELEGPYMLKNLYWSREESKPRCIIFPGENHLTCRTPTSRGSLHPTYNWTGQEDYRERVWVVITKQTALLLHGSWKRVFCILTILQSISAC